ncbi:MAG: LytR C-terminal domain-containing protein, partial [Chloroflexota bacterium]
MIAEGAQLAILNGTTTPGLAGRTSEYLVSLGASVVSIGDAELKPYAYTNIYDHSGNPYTLRYYVELMKLTEFRIHTNYAPERVEDVTIILGNDWFYDNPMP